MNSLLINDRRGWSLILLLFIMASFVAMFPLVSSFSDNRANLTTAFERWTQWQKAKEGALQLAAANFMKEQSSITYLLPGGNTLTVTVNPTESPSFTDVPFVSGQSGTVEADSVFNVFNSNGTVWQGVNMPDGGSYEIVPGGGANLSLVLKDPSGSTIDTINLGNPANGRILKIESASGKVTYFITTDTTYNLTDDSGFQDDVWQAFSVSQYNGAGTEDDPFLIRNATQLSNVRNDLNSGVHYKIIAPIDLGVSPWSDGNGWTPIGTPAAPFRGVLTVAINSATGQSYPVDGLSLKTAMNGYTGLFGVISGGKVTGLRLTNVDVDGWTTNRADLTGTIAGLIDNNTELSDCLADGTVRGFCYLGGLVGYVRGSKLASCTSLVNVTANGDGTNNDLTSRIEFVGGLAGRTDSSSDFSFCSNSGQIIVEFCKTAKKIGGLAGYADATPFVKCSNSGEISIKTLNAENLDPEAVGGLVGESFNLSFTESFNTGSIVCNIDSTVNFSSSRIGGISGKSSQVTFTDTYNSGRIVAGKPGNSEYSGGISGYSNSTILKNCSNSGEIFGARYLGGLCGYIMSNSKIEDSHNTGQVVASASAISHYNIGGIAGELYLGEITNSYNTGQVTAESAAPNVNEHVGGVAGLIQFGKIANSYNTGLVRVDAFGRFTGGLVGRTHSSTVPGYTIIECYNSGNVSGRDYCGGLIGSNGYNSSSFRGYQILRCFSTGTVSGNNGIGGLIGYNGGFVHSCFSHGDVRGLTYVGGLAGMNRYFASIDHCYSTGKVSGGLPGGLVGDNSAIVSAAAYWNIQTSGAATSFGGTWLTSAQMLSQASYVGWDFTNIWKITDANGINVLPYLRWYDKPGDTVSPNIGTLKYVGAGTFQRNEVPINLTTVSAFRIGQKEITRQQFFDRTGYDPTTVIQSTGMNDPVFNVNWLDAVEFCNLLSIAESLPPVYTITNRNPAAGYPILSADIVMNLSAKGYRLPTDQEWMWAAIGADCESRGAINRTGYLKPFAGSTGSNNASDYAWYNINSGGRSQPVASKLPNETGLYDMSGNAYEWVWDWKPSVAPIGLLNNYTGPAMGTAKIMRGGQFDALYQYLNLKDGPYLPPSPAFLKSGLRVLRPL